MSEQMVRISSLEGRFGTPEIGSRVIKDTPKVEMIPTGWCETVSNVRVIGVANRKSWNYVFTPKTHASEEMPIEAFMGLATTPIIIPQRNERHVKETIKTGRNTLKVAYRDLLASQLLDLLQDSIEEEPDALGISIDSLQSFFDFVNRYPYLKKPAIALSPDKNVYASWRSDDRVFSIHFLPSGSVRFVVIIPNHVIPEHSVRVSGESEAKNLIERVEAWGVLQWARVEGL
jgi:hypothetical protein